MLNVSDILKLLDQIPIWKTLRVLPARVEALEQQVAALQAAAAAPAQTPGQPCPACGAHALRRTSSRESVTPFGLMGARDETWTCTACGATDERSAVSSKR